MGFEEEQLKIQRDAMENNPETIQAETMREDRVMNILSQINPDNLLTDIEHRLRGEKKNIYTGNWESIKEGYCPIDEKMIVKFMSFLGGVLNQNVSLSNFNAMEINNMMELIIEWVADDLDVNDENYGIKDQYTEMTRIGNLICISVFSTLKQAQNGMLAKRIFSSIKVNASLTPAKDKGLKDYFKM
jgi:hypothetical protein